MKILIILLSAILFSQVLVTSSFAELDGHTSQVAYAPGEPLFVYGFGEPNEPIILRLYAPDNTVAEFQQIITFSTEKMKQVDTRGHYESDDETGFFFKQLKELQLTLDGVFENTEENK